MKASRFIAGRLRFQGRLAMASIALSFMIMVLALCISAGFRREIRSAVSAVSGDIQLTPRSMDSTSEDDPVSSEPSFLGALTGIRGVESVEPVIYRAGIVRTGDTIHGVMFKGTAADTASLGVRIPSRLASILSLSVGDKMTAYFVGSRVKVRRFTITGIYDPVLDADAALVVYAPISDMRRLNGWEEGTASALEVTLDGRHKSPDSISAKNMEVGALVGMSASGTDEEMVATSVMRRYPQLFGWLDLLDFNVLILLILMTVVAGFNMISGLLILLFRHISTIGILKAMGMSDRSISAVFLRLSSALVLKGMAIGNALALLLCAVQWATHAVRLNPDNYFVSFVPVAWPLPLVAACDVVAWGVIMLLLLLPARFISRVDPARTVKAA